ncbi:2-oxo acid dehydrogenase subunit E2 [soil metagenome]
MSRVFRLPDLGEGLTEADIVEWHVAEGDEVTIDQEVVTVETAKAAVGVPCPYAGTVTSLHGSPGETLAVGAPLITIGTADLPDVAGGDQYRTEERAGAVPEQAEPARRAAAEMPTPADHPATAQADDPAAQADDPAAQAAEGSGAVLIGYGTGKESARRSRRRRGSATEPVATVSEPHDVPRVRRATAGSSARSDTEPAVGRDEAGRPTAVKVISPLVRRLATDAGLDLTDLRPSGPGGVVRRADVEAAMAQADGAAAARTTGSPASTTPPPTGAPHTGAGEATRIPLTGVRRAVADKLTTSRREIPDATTWVDADATELIATRDALKRLRPQDGIGILALIARITVAGLQRHPELNSSVDAQAGEIVQHAGINLGFAAQSPRGLVVPVVHGADRLSTAELAAALRELTEGARQGTLTPGQLTGGTFTLNNYGVFGVDGSTPIINHPEAAMLGVGRIIDKPWAHQGEVALRKVTQLSFTFDHRVCDGGTAGGFLRFVADCVEQPAVLLAQL